MKIINLPNLLTLLRIALVPVFTLLFLKEEYRYALAVFAVTALTDMVDGFLARTLKKKTTLGAMLDPAADKFLMLVAFVVTALKGLVPIWLSCGVILRDAWIIAGVGILKRLKKKLYFKPTVLSKANTFCQLLTIFFAFSLIFFREEQMRLFLGTEKNQGGLHWDPLFIFIFSERELHKILEMTVYLTGAMTVLSGFQYTRIGWMIFKKDRNYAELPLQDP